MGKNSIFNDLVSNIELKDVDMRKIYDDSINYMYGKNNNVIEVKESEITRVMVNNIRHTKTNYDKSLKKIRKINDNKNTYYHIYKNDILSEIENKYPVLGEECNRQKTVLPMARLVKKKKKRKYYRKNK